MRPLRLSLSSFIRLSLFFVSFALAILVKKVYRQWIYQRGVVGLGIEDWGPSLFYIFGMLMLAASLIATTGRLKDLKYQTMAGIILGAIIYEISHYFRSDRWFSWEDLIATISGGVAALLTEVILSKVENKRDMRSTNRRR